MARPVRPSPEIVHRIRLLVDTTSISEVGRRLRLADATVCRLAGGLPVAEGTILVVVHRLAEAEEKAA